MSNSKYGLLVTVIFVLIAAGSGFYLGKTFGYSKIGGPIPANNNSIFAQQSATIQGKVTKVDGNTLTVQNNNNVSASFPSADKIFISKVESSNLSATPSSDLKTIELNRDAFINLQIVDGQYKIVSVAILPQLQPLPPAGGQIPPNTATSGAVKR